MDNSVFMAPSSLPPENKEALTEVPEEGLGHRCGAGNTGACKSMAGRGLRP